MNKIKTIKIKNEDGSISEESYAIAADALNIDMVNGKNVQETIGTTDVDKDGDIATQLKNTISKNDIIDNLNSSDANKALSAKQGKVLGDAVAAANLDIKKKIYYYDTIADMKADENLQVGDTCQTLGYYNKNDGGMATYKIRNITNNDIVDNMVIIALSNNNLVAELILTESITPEMLGAKANGIDSDIEVFEKIVTLNKKIKLNSKIYILDETLIIDNNTNINIEGTGQHSIIKYTGIGDCIQLNSSFIETLRNNIPTTILKNFHIQADRTKFANGLHIHGRENSVIDTLWIDGFKGNGLKIHTRESWFNNIKTRYNGDYENSLSDVYLYYDNSLGDRNNDNHFTNCEFIFSLFDIMKTENSSEILFESCMFHNMANSIMTDVYPNIYPNTTVTPTEIYGTTVNMNLLNSDSYAISNCTFRIGGSNIIKLDNSPRNKMVNCNLSSFKVWSPTPYVVSASNNSSLIMDNITFGDIGYIFENDESSNVIIGKHLIQRSGVTQNTMSNQQMKNYYPVFYPSIETEAIKPRYGNITYTGGRTGFSNWFIMQANNENNQATNCIIFSGSNTNLRKMGFQTNTVLQLATNQAKKVSLQANETQRAISHGLNTDNFICIATPSWKTKIYTVAKSSTTATIRWDTPVPSNDDYVDILFFPL